MQFALFIFISRRWDADKLIIKKFISYFKKMKNNVAVS
jgi:hypothetical protein